MHFTAGETADKLGISKDTLRYYEQEGILPPIARDERGHRTFTESDVQWIFLIRCLRDTDMSMRDIKRYIALLREGSVDSVRARRQILSAHQKFIEAKIIRYRFLLGLIDKKLEFYDELLDVSVPETAVCADYTREWDHFRTILKEMDHA